MNTNDQNMNDQQAFNELLGDDRFDDSVNEQHQTDLRSKMLQAFDTPDADSAVVELHREDDDRSRGRRSRKFGWAVALVACVTGVIAASFYSSIFSDRVEGPIVDANVDPEFVASLNEVIVYRDDVPPDELFYAIAMCELEHEGREQFE